MTPRQLYFVGMPTSFVLLLTILSASSLGFGPVSATVAATVACGVGALGWATSTRAPRRQAARSPMGRARPWAERRLEVYRAGRRPPAPLALVLSHDDPYAVPALEAYAAAAELGGDIEAASEVRELAARWKEGPT